MDRLYTTMTIDKAFDDGDERIIEGVASTNDIDLVGDIVEPSGAEFKTPLPLLWQHDAYAPVGVVEKATVLKNGIKFRARLAKVDGPPGLKNRIDEAWASVKAGLIRAVSIGFKGVERAAMNNGGIHFIKWRWLELSLVTVPANPNATITQIRAYHDERGESAAHARRVVSVTPAGVAAKSQPRNSGNTDMKIAEQIKALEDDIRRKTDRATEIQTKASAAGRSKEAGEKEEFDRLTGEIEVLKDELADLKKLESLEVAKATPVEAKTEKAGSLSRDHQARVVFNNNRGGDGIGFAQALMCRAIGKMAGVSAVELAKEHYSYDPRIEALCKSIVMKAAVEGAVTSVPAYAGYLADPQDLAAEFIAYMFPKTIVGKLTRVNRVPFNYEIPQQTSPSTAYWTGEGKPAPVSKLAFANKVIGKTSITGLLYTSKQNLRFANRDAEAIFRNDLVNAAVKLMDTDFVDPANAGTANVKPASITNGLTATAPSGTDGDAVRADMQKVLQKIVQANLSLSEVTLITRDDLALALSLLTNALGQPEFPNMGPSGGSLLNMPVIVSNSVQPGDIIAVHEPSIYLAKDDQVMIDMSTEAAIEASDGPGQDGAAGTGAAMVSLWQTRMVGFLAELYANWVVARTGAVSHIAVAAYNGAPSA